jgi:hypothetical protein
VALFNGTHAVDNPKSVPTISIQKNNLDNRLFFISFNVFNSFVGTTSNIFQKLLPVE